MNANEMLVEVHRHKDACVAAMVSRDKEARREAEEAAKNFLVDNFAQILDILDDSLTAHLNGGK